MCDFADSPKSMIPLKNIVSKALGGTYVTNIRIGDSDFGDLVNGYLVTMDDEVEHFADAIKADPKLASGFHALGYSQGNLLIGGYIQRYNDPPVINWVSIHGPKLDVASIPKCKANLLICEAIDDLLSIPAYTPFTQNHLAQTNYLRLPYDRADLNGEKEGQSINTNYGVNFGKVQKMAFVKAKIDTTVDLPESERLVDNVLISCGHFFAKLIPVTRYGYQVELLR